MFFHIIFLTSVIGLALSVDSAFENNNEKNTIIPEYHVLKNWPAKYIKFGQVSSVAYDTKSNIYIFHRGDRIWGSDTFNNDNIYKHKGDGPISVDTILVINPNTGHLVQSWGSNLFYMPHGLTVDAYDNLWITDVALHQVFKFSHLNNTSESSTPSLTLGMAFIPGRSHKQFCKPTSVAVMSNGDFWVADGYCNDRIMKFNADGIHLSEIGRSTMTTGMVPVAPYHLQVPHSMALAEDLNTLCVADRENGRVECFDCHNGTFIKTIGSPAIGHKVYGVSFAHMNDGILFLVNGPEIYTPAVKVQGFAIDFHTSKILSIFSPEMDDFHMPHDLISFDNGSRIFVVEITPPRVWQFLRNDINLTISEEVWSRPQSFLPIFHPLTSGSSTEESSLILAVLIVSAVLLFGISVLAASFIYTKAKSSGRRRRRTGSVEQLFLEETQLAR